MKNTLLILSLLLTFFLSSCSNDCNIEKPAENRDQKVSVKADIVDNKDLRIVYQDNGTKLMTAEWSKADTFQMLKRFSNDVQTFVNSADDRNTFSGLIPKGEGNYYGVYGDVINRAGDSLLVSVYEQIGTAEEYGITEFMVAESNDLNSSFKFKHKLTVLKLILQLPDDVEEKMVKKVTVCGLFNHAFYNLGTQSFEYFDPSFKYYNSYCFPIEVRNHSQGFAIDENRKITVYVAVFPEKVEANEVTIKAETDNELYYYTIKNETTLPEGKVVPVDVQLTKVEHESVDLGLPSGTLWATMNVGSVSPEDFGDFYAWGETDTKTYYIRNSYNVPENLVDIAGTDYDVAHVKWRERWCMPTQEQIVELFKYCEYSWVDDYVKDGTYIGGFVVKSKVKGYENKEIFLPASGYRYGVEAVMPYYYGCYWSSLSDVDDSYSAYGLGFGVDISDPNNSMSWKGDDVLLLSEDGTQIRFCGQPIRPVLNPNTTTSSGTTDLGTSDDSGFYK